MDLRIAAVVLENAAVLVSRNSAISAECPA